AGEINYQRRVWPLEHDLRGQRVGRLDVVYRVNLPAARVELLGRRVLHPFDIRFDVLARERRAIVELDPRVELEDDTLAIAGDLVGVGKVWDDLVVGV